MDRQEEEREDRERRIESSIGKFIPHDLISDILLKLPAKSAVRFRCVSKLWSSITTPPDFLRSFAIQSSTRLRFMVCVRTSNTRLFISMPQHEYDKYDTSYSHDVHRYDDNHSALSESVQGLVCYGDFFNIVIWNPSMRQHVTLPEHKPKVKIYARCFGYDPVEGKYKVLCISNNKHHLVFTLGPQESWRLINNLPRHILEFTKVKQIGVCVNGHVYYEAKILRGDTLEYEDILMSFHVRYETFKTIEKPNDHTLCKIIINYQGKLAWVCRVFNSLFRFWVLEDGERQEWSLREFRLPFPLGSILPQPDLVWNIPLFFCGVTRDTGELMFARTMFKTIYVLYYEPIRERTRRIEYEGIGNKKFWIRNGIELDRSYSSSTGIYWFPNHSESLMSLENVPGLVFNTDSE